MKFDVSASSKFSKQEKKITQTQIYWKSFRVEWFNLKIVVNHKRGRWKLPKADMIHKVWIVSRKDSKFALLANIYPHFRAELLMYVIVVKFYIVYVGFRKLCNGLSLLYILKTFLTIQEMLNTFFSMVS